MKTYRAKFNPQSKNVFGVSLVENPAMEGDFIQFNKDNENITFADVDKSKRRVMGLILEPNKLIYRNQGGEQFNIVFTEQDIEDVAYNFQKQSNQNTSTIGHSGKNIDGVSFVELWIVENPKIDKSTNFGFSYPKGSWMGVMQLDNDDVWNEYVETGKVKGFSIDAFMQLEEINLNNVNMSDKKEENVVLSAIKKGFAELKASFIPEQPKKEKEVELKEEVKEVEVKESETVELKETKEVEKVEFNEAEFISNFIKEMEAIFSPIKDENVALKEQLKGIETKLEKQNEVIVELSKSPATKSINKNATTLDLKKEYKDMTNREKMEYNRLNK